MSATSDKVISAYTTRCLINYLQKCSVNLNDYFEKTDTLPHILMDNSGWVPFESWLNLLHFVMRVVNKDAQTIGYEANKLIYDNQSFRMRFLSRAPLWALKNLLPYLSERYFNRALRMSIDTLPDMVYYRVHYRNMEYYHADLCGYNYGAVKAVAYLRKITSATIIHTACVSKGDSYCEYKIDMSTKEAPCYCDHSVPLSAEDIDLAFQKESQCPILKTK
jgi:hypothetical protein